MQVFEEFWFSKYTFILKLKNVWITDYKTQEVFKRLHLRYSQKCRFSRSSINFLHFKRLFEDMFMLLNTDWWWCKTFQESCLIHHCWPIREVLKDLFRDRTMISLQEGRFQNQHQYHLSHKFVWWHRYLEDNFRNHIDQTIW